MLRWDEVSEELGRKSKDEQALLHSPGSSTARKARGENVLCPAALTAPTLRVTCTQQRLLQPGQELLQGPSSRPTALTSSGDCCRLPRLPFFTNTSLVIFLPKSCYLTFILKKGTKNTYYVHFNRTERKYNSTYFWLQNSDFLANHKILPLQSGPWRGVY